MISCWSAGFWGYACPWETQASNQAIGTGVLVGGGRVAGKLRIGVADAGWLYALRHLADLPDYAWSSGQIGFGAL